MQGIREAGDLGYPAVMQNNVSSEAFEQLARATAQRVAIRNAEKAETKKVEIKV